jgi:hypothetical protein
MCQRNQDTDTKRMFYSSYPYVIACILALRSIQTSDDETLTFELHGGHMRRTSSCPTAIAGRSHSVVINDVVDITHGIVDVRIMSRDGDSAGI